MLLEQRIEGLWSILRKSKTGWWIDKFQVLQIVAVMWFIVHNFEHNYENGDQSTGGNCQVSGGRPFCPVLNRPFQNVYFCRV